MPLVRISLKSSRSQKHRHGIADCVHRAMVQAIGIPEGDRFQIISMRLTWYTIPTISTSSEAMGL